MTQRTMLTRHTSQIVIEGSITGYWQWSWTVFCLEP